MRRLDTYIVQKRPIVSLEVVGCVACADMCSCAAVVLTQQNKKEAIGVVIVVWRAGAYLRVEGRLFGRCDSGVGNEAITAHQSQTATQQS